MKKRKGEEEGEEEYILFLWVRLRTGRKEKTNQFAHKMEEEE